MKIKELFKSVDDRIQLIAQDPKTEKSVVVFDGLPNIELLEKSVKNKRADLIFFNTDDDTGELVLTVVFQQKLPK